LYISNHQQYVAAIKVIQAEYKIIVVNIYYNAMSVMDGTHGIVILIYYCDFELSLKTSLQPQHVADDYLYTKLGTDLIDVCFIGQYI
jgi:hypothetical protein